MGVTQLLKWGSDGGKDGTTSQWKQYLAEVGIQVELLSRSRVDVIAQMAELETAAHGARPGSERLDFDRVVKVHREYAEAEEHYRRVLSKDDEACGDKAGTAEGPADTPCCVTPTLQTDCEQFKPMPPVTSSPPQVAGGSALEQPGQGPRFAQSWWDRMKDSCCPCI
jgi:hypothetical protein